MEPTLDLQAFLAPDQERDGDEGSKGGLGDDVLEVGVDRNLELLAHKPHDEDREKGVGDRCADRHAVDAVGLD